MASAFSPPTQIFSQPTSLFLLVCELGVPVKQVNKNSEFKLNLGLVSVTWEKYEGLLAVLGYA